jgi:exopolysaccharide biosynthesis polyprenyl glycosylphosphotransferase
MLIHVPKKQLTLLGGDAIIIFASFYLAPFIIFGVLLDASSIFTPGDVAAFLTYLLMFYVFDFYNLDEPLNIGYSMRFAAALMIGNILIGVSSYLMRVQLYSGTVFLFNSLLIMCFCLGWRLIFHRFLKHHRKPWRVIIIGCGRAGRVMGQALSGNQAYEVVGFLDDDCEKLGMNIGARSVMGSTEMLASFLVDKNIDNIIVAITHGIRPGLYARLVEAKMRGIVVYDMPSFYEKILGKIPVNHVSDLWIVYTPISGVKRNIFNYKVKRICDICLSMVGLVLNLPIAALVALAIKLDSPGPLFYVQRRIGWNERAFDLVKFRSMKDGTHTERDFAGQRCDPRITRVGRVLRLFRLDEVPQLWNVLKGDMSFIGPRALMAEEVHAFTSQIPYFNLRHSIRPGITGWAQINYPHGATENDALEKLQYDLFYVKNLSPLLDLRIFLRTFYIVLFGKGAR